ncbi:type I-D CRISPR-associated protein Cas7/Csc2 [Cylindrospermopsis raciborskii]|uniref:Type I-D CRISPR-associated protein Cas7/Csc2 n=1 Tax=Cylindrospermopsis raciborskii CENA302 TaxID=1170768 RepID=A0A9Q5QUA8_9CYAN|nr:type I-D CRISPR-associated protein Cas7/Csc2 [Cylindrospermopsis raciborskii]NLQ04780.1 type I-D CRISPR-associated protein Cas7/Csc2 [Cylindrospermopsis raciborskii MVCC19]OHY33676.1 type I-D CRISPR-associated protein Cas7/Csc2 [Cylindrospermopsis raciborskii MVCC14]OPH08451.1 type I-D CRISPR-associated protein Cas7/Csc2 [Cylindrospermopsis raciborskii CENA302]
MSFSDGFLDSIKPEFSTALPRLASGKYVHFVMLRHSQCFPILQPDGVLNTVRTQAGIQTSDVINRLVMPKHQQTTSARLVGRELLFSLGLASDNPKDKDKFCEYNGENCCKQCPNCIIYGFASNEGGLELAKVYSDSAFSLGDAKSNDVIAEITFPTVATLCDPTFESFLYVLGNLLHTPPQMGMSNHVIGIVLCDGEIFSNLHFTQALYDVLKSNLNSSLTDLITKATEVSNNLLNQEPVTKTRIITGSQLINLLTEVSILYQDRTKLKTVMTTLCQQTKIYAQIYGDSWSSRSKEIIPNLPFRKRNFISLDSSNYQLINIS